MKSVTPDAAEMQIDLRILVYREDAYWLAHCLELDIVAEGESPQSATKDLIDLCSLQIKTALAESDSVSIFRPAPAEFWKLFFTAKKKKPSKISRNSPIAQIDERELELV